MAQRVESRNAESFPINEELIDYYQQAQNDYAYWSKAYNMHFGYFKKDMNTFRLEPMLKQMNLELLQHLSLEGKEQIADLGCGTGATARDIIELQPDCRIDALTLVPDQIEMGEKLNRLKGFEGKIRFHQQNFNDTRFEDGTFHRAYAVESACYAPGPAKASILKEAFRILKPKGKLVVVDAFRKTTGALPQLAAKAYKRACEAWLIPSMANVEMMREEALHIGFRKVQVYDVSWHVAPSVAHVPFKVLGFILRSLLKGELLNLDRHRRNNLIAPAASVILGLHRRHFAYCILVAER